MVGNDGNYLQDKHNYKKNCKKTTHYYSAITFIFVKLKTLNLTLTDFT